MNIAIMGRVSYAQLLEKKLPKQHNIIRLPDKYTKKIDIKNINVLITMNWGKALWGERKPTPMPYFKGLKLIQLPGSGFDGIDFSLLPKNCLVCNVYEHAIPVAEYVIANLLNNEIMLFQKVKNFKRYNWNDSMLFSLNPKGELNRKKIGIIGYGRIGKEIAKKLFFFNTDTIVVSRKKIKKSKFFKKNIFTENLIKEANELDYLIVACDLNSSSRNLINKKVFDAINKKCVIVNVARGPIINEKDLYQALKQKKIAGAILDAWYNYPSTKNKNCFSPSKYDFNKLKNVLMTPHLSALSQNLIERRIKVILQNIESLEKGKKLKNIIYYEKSK